MKSLKTLAFVFAISFMTLGATAQTAKTDTTKSKSTPVMKEKTKTKEKPNGTTKTVTKSKPTNKTENSSTTK